MVSRKKEITDYEEKDHQKYYGQEKIGASLCDIFRGAGAHKIHCDVVLRSRGELELPSF